MRIGFGWAEPESDVDDEDSLRIMRVPFDIVYNWEGGAIHPFVGAGLGAYFLQLKDNGESFGDSETKLGATLFGGAEFFTGRTAALKAEARYHIVDDVLGIEPEGLSLTIGFRSTSERKRVCRRPHAGDTHHTIATATWPVRSFPTLPSPR